jgi:UDP-N-acetylbacillosamine N-acetyltransferase
MKMEKKILILGAGQYGHLVKEIAAACGYDQVDFLDDFHPAAIGTFADAYRFVSEYPEAVVAIGNVQVRRKCLDILEDAGFRIPVLCHPRAYIYHSAQVSAGCILEPMAVVSSRAKLERGCILSAGAVVNHDSWIEECSHVDCNGVVSARSHVPPGTRVGCGTVFDQE